jgi:hypothetical protein
MISGKLHLYEPQTDHQVGDKSEAKEILLGCNCIDQSCKPNWKSNNESRKKGYRNREEPHN